MNTGDPTANGLTDIIEDSEEEFLRSPEDFCEGIIRQIERNSGQPIAVTLTARPAKEP